MEIETDLGFISYFLFYTGQCAENKQFLIVTNGSVIVT